ncbi:MAG TPA: 30S ribosomal protein S20 [Candidatus Caccopulliclostridium gallistercoris]|uniref:Small ribosomal subunit protein bS20 n=1 Tax=Candidatus Caccopulliclostridium gallistercoris TaxID=2840719 RepID=A0A9D1SZD1_9FIRM|nr:30S ribosomal protein S20 [Candidatus Caccopulliclostridium gallistercoris]
MPNIKSAIKRVEVIERNNKQNRSTKSEINTFIKKFKAAVEAKNASEAEELYKKVSGLLDSAARENVIHANSAARKKAHFSKMLDDMKKSA